MGGPRCPRCDRGKGRRCHRDGALEQVLSGVYIYPFRCSLCGHRFRALAWGRRYVKQSVDRREWDPVAVRAPVVLRTGDASAAGEATALSFQGFTVKTEARLTLRSDSSTYHLRMELDALEDDRRLGGVALLHGRFGNGGPSGRLGNDWLGCRQ